MRLSYICSIIWGRKEVEYLEKKVLIIDDIYISEMYLKKHLLMKDMVLLVLILVRKPCLYFQKSKPDLVLLDLMLPGLSGEEVLPHIKGIPVIVMSAKVDIDNKVELLLGGAVDYMTKPFHTKELLARIAVHLRTFNTFDKPKVLTFGEIELASDTHIVQIKDQKI